MQAKDDASLADELASCKVIDRDLDARIAVALYSDARHADDRDNTRALMPTKFDECAPGTYWISTSSGLSLRTAPGFTSDKILRDLAISALRRAALSTAQASEREKIMALAIEDAVAKHDSIVIEPMGDGLGWAATDTDSEDRVWHPLSVARSEPSPVERVARAVAESCHVDLSVAIHEAGGITKAIAIFGMDGISDDPRYKDWRIPSCRGVMQTAHAALAALQPPPIEQPAPAEAQQPSDGLAEELERRATFGGEIGTFQCPPELTARILAALKTRTSSETVERWQPIEGFAEPTALSRGNGVFVADADGTVGEAYFRNFGDESDGWWWSNTSWGDYPEPSRPCPTHWQPLPEPPGHLSNTPDQGSDQHG